MRASSLKMCAENEIQLQNIPNTKPVYMTNIILGTKLNLDWY
jgi:hypothetical protein